MIESTPHPRPALAGTALDRSAQACRSGRFYSVWAILYAIIAAVYFVAAWPVVHHDREVVHWLQLGIALFWAWLCI